MRDLRERMGASLLPASGWPIYAILTVAVVARIVMFQGLSEGDDLSYSRFANELAEGKYQPVYLNHWSMRIGLIVPTAIFYRMFGVNEVSMVLFPLLCSIALIAVAYAIGRRFFGPEIGLITAFLLAVFPLNIVYSTQLFPDISLALFVGLSGYYYMKSLEAESALRGSISTFAAGICLGLGYLMKEVAILFLIPVFIYGLIHVRGRFRRTVMETLSLLVGAGFFLLVEGIFYRIYAGDFLFRFREFLLTPSHGDQVPTQAASAGDSCVLQGLGEAVVSGFSAVAAYLGGFWERFVYMLGFYDRLFEFKEYDIPLFIKMVLPYYCGLHYLAVYIAVILIVFLYFRKVRSDKHLQFTFIWWLSLFLYITLGSSAILTYKPQAPNPRYLHFIEIPAFILLSAVLLELSRKWGRRFLNITLVVLFLGSAVSLWVQTQIPLTREPRLTRGVFEVLEEIPQKRIYTDQTTMRSLKFLFGYDQRVDLLVSFSEDEIDFVPDSYVVLNWWNLYLGKSHKGFSIEDRFYDPPADWQLVREIEPVEFRYFDLFVEQVRKYRPGLFMRKTQEKAGAEIYYIPEIGNKQG